MFIRVVEAYNLKYKTYKIVYYISNIIFTVIFDNIKILEETHHFFEIIIMLSSK